MATPMNMRLGVCGQCWGPDKGGTFDVPFDGSEWLLINVCPECRYWETRAWIQRRSSY